MYVELIHDEHDGLSLGIVNIDQLADTVCPVDPRSLAADPDVSPALQQGGDEETTEQTTPTISIHMVSRITTVLSLPPIC